MLSACATDHASKAELTELAASVRALRAENARLEVRLDHLAEQVSAGSRRQPPAATNSAALVSPPPARATPADALPSLTVVKLKPRRDPVPALNTAVAVVEPAPESLDSMKAEPPPNDEVQLAAAEQQYERGVDLLKSGNPEQGISTLMQFTADQPRHPRADNALYFAGLGMMALKDFEGAERLFARVGVAYPAGDVVLDARLKQAECLHRLGRPRDARVTLEQIIASAPGTAAASQAQARLTSSTPSSASSPSP